MVREVVVVIEEDPLHQAAHPQVGRAFDDVAARVGMVGVLERAPVEGECDVAGEPARETEIQQYD